MTEDYLTDDEQLEQVKRAAAEYGAWVLGAVVLGLGFVVAYRYYDNRENERALRASTQFGNMASAVQMNDSAKARQIAASLIKDYPGSPYADQAQLTLARLYVDQGQDASAVAPLTEVIDHSKDAELKHIARLRLARLWIDMGKPDQALDALSDEPGTFAARYHEVRGDAYYAKKDTAKAAEQYQAALGAGSADSMDSALLALKISDLGVPAGPPALSLSGAPSAGASNKVKP
jgi:predicted negative regulator of RcsB-dependent stress response